jgi:hypothetical protein
VEKHIGDINTFMSDKGNVLTLLTALQRTPSTELTDQELDDCMIKFGSYVCIVKNRALNQISMIVEVIKDTDLQQDFCDYFSCENFSVALSLIFSYNPQLVKSKAIKDNIKRWKQNGIKKY